tara:strand:- start:266 stop:415 length:150 start_codon:yes stop_codon:yes gene_type:complete
MQNKKINRAKIYLQLYLSGQIPENDWIELLSEIPELKKVYIDYIKVNKK